MPYLNAVYCISEKMELRSFHFTQAVHSRHSKNAFRKKNVVPLFQRPRLTHIHLFMFYGALPHSGDRWAGAEPSGHLWTGYQPTAEHVQYCINKPITHRIHTQGQFWVEKEPKHTCAWSVSWVFNQALFCFVLLFKSSPLQCQHFQWCDHGQENSCCCEGLALLIRENAYVTRGCWHAILKWVEGAKRKSFGVQLGVGGGGGGVNQVVFHVRSDGLDVLEFYRTEWCIF